MPFMQGCDLLNATSGSINTVVYMDFWTDLFVFSNQYSTHCEILGLVFKTFQSISHPLFPLENGGSVSDRYLCIYNCIYI